MDTVKYPLNNKLVKKLKCPNCKTEVLAWVTSGMSDSLPHFYCDKCSNVIQRESDKIKVYYGGNDETLKEIDSTLPYCGCGGKFRAGANPKCPKCNFEFKHQHNPIIRLTDSHMILINGAMLYDETGPKYRIEIG